MCDYLFRVPLVQLWGGPNSYSRFSRVFTKGAGRFYGAILVFLQGMHFQGRARIDSTIYLRFSFGLL